MDSWTLQGDSYSCLRSAPHTFSLCHRDGTPNHVEIFDIINIPRQRSAISETTCLCDIFGDDCELPSNSSSPAAGAFVFAQREADGTATVSPPVDDLNDSLGSYHTAQGSSEGEETFEDSRERLYSPLLQGDPSERRQSKSEGLSSGLPDISADNSPNSEPKSKSPVSQFNKTSQPSEVLNTGERTTSSGHNSPYTLSSEGRASSLSSSSVEKRHSPASPNLSQVDSEAEQSRITSIYTNRQSSPSHQSLTPISSSESRNCVSSSSSESVNTQSSHEFMVAQVSPEPSSSYFNQLNSPSPESTSKDSSLDFTESDSRANFSSPSPSPSSAELSSHSRETLLSPNLKNRPHSPDSQASSPFLELRERLSLPEPIDRGSTPDIQDPPCTPELISDPSTAGRDTSSPENQNTRLSAEPVSAVDIPDPQYTTPSPVISVATLPELLESSATPELRHKTPSPGRLSAASPVKPGAETLSPDPSPKIGHISTPEINTQVSSPVLSYSLSPSPQLRSSCSPLEHITPSPEIRITASSPEVSRREVDTASASPLLEPHFESASSRSLASSPHITGISYSIVEPDNRDTALFPELSHLSSPEPDRILVSPEARSPTPSSNSIQQSITESTSTPRDSPHISDFTSSVVQPETILPHHQRYQTPSPLPKNHTPSPEPRYPTPLSDKYQSLSPQHKSKTRSPVAPSPEQRYYQQSPAALSAEYSPHNTQPTLFLRNTPEGERDSSPAGTTEIQYPTLLEKGNVLPLFELDTAVVAEIRSSSTVEAIHSPVSATSIEVNIQDNSSSTSFSEEIQNLSPAFSQKEDLYNNPPTETKSPSPNLLASKDTSPNISPVQRQENLHHQFTTHSLTCESTGSLKSTSTSEHSRKQLSSKLILENRKKFTDSMAHHVNRRRTPSPPLTRFTPVHIIAPEKPYRQWQNRSCSSSQVIASSLSGNLKKAVTNRKSPNVAAVNNSQGHLVRLENQMEMERDMQLEDKREVGRERRSDREIERERKREQQICEKEEGWQGDTSYRGEQAELSFNARNRKGPASHSTATTNRETHQGLPTVHSYSENLLGTRQLHQQQRLLKLVSQQDTRGAGPSRRLQPPTPRNKSSAPGHVTASRPCQSSSSSMGSELDEADNEVKWFTDVAFSSLSGPETDYLDMYNSSHRSSTNISQPSTQESPAGISAAWMAYADFKGSATKPDNDELAFQQQSTCYSDGLDPSRRYEMGSFECIDVVLEREDFRKVRRGVPKRQIQLKRKNNTEGKQDGSSENDSPGESFSLDSHPREAFLRQHTYPSEHSPDPNEQNERKSRLQKSSSLDETCPKTKMATCLIKSVLSKKMQCGDKQPDEQAGEEVSPAFEENSSSTESAAAEAGARYLSSGLHSDHSLSSVGLPVKGDPSAKDDAKPQKNFGVRSSNRPSSSSSSRSVNFSQTDSEDADSQSWNSLRSEMRSELKLPFEEKSRTGVQRAGNSKSWDEREGDDSANATARNTGAPSATGAKQMTNRDQECENKEDHKQCEKTQDISLKAVEKKKASLNVCLTPEAENKPKSSSPDMFVREKEERVDENTAEEEEANENTKFKTPIHKVRDVRRLVKNTYNLSFNATSALLSSDVNEEKTENFNEERREEIKEERREEVMAGEEREVRQEMTKEEREEEVRVERKEEQTQDIKDLFLQCKGKPLSQPQPMQIEYKAVCWKGDTNRMSHSVNDSENPGDKPQTSPKPVTEVSKKSQKSLNANIQHYTTGDTAIAKSCQHDLNMAIKTQETVTEMHKVSDIEHKPVVIRTDRKPPMLGSLPKLPSKEREVSTAVVLIRDGASKTKTSASPAQEELPTRLQASAAPPSPGLISSGSPPESSGHSVSMLLKEKGYQADIGAVVGDSQDASGGKGVPLKHVNCLKIPLQTAVPSDGSRAESQRERTFSSSSNMSGPSVVSDNTESLTKAREDEGVIIKPTVKDTTRQKSASPLRNIQEQTPPLTKVKEDFEVKRLDSTFPPRSPAIRRFRPQPIEVKSLSKETQKGELTTNSSGNNTPQTIEVKSITKNSQKPAVPPKPSWKFKPADLGAMPNEAQRLSMTTSAVKPQGDERPQTIVVSSPTIYRKISSDSTSSSNYTRKLAVSAVSSLKPPPNKTTATIMSSLSNQLTPSDTKPSDDRVQQQQPAASQYTQRPTALDTTSASGPGLTSSPGPLSDPTAIQEPGPPSATANQPSQPAAPDPDNQPQYHRTAYPPEQAMSVASNNTKQPAAVSATQVPGHTHQPYCGSLSREHSQGTDDLRFYASDDPPSYDERESFSPLILPHLTPRRTNRYQPSSHPPPCSCTAGCLSHPGFTPAHHHHSPHNLTPPAHPHSPGHALPYPVVQPPVRPHQCRPDPQLLSYQPSSPKASPLGANQPPALYQPLHQTPPCPPHPSLMQAWPAERLLQPPQHGDPRRPPVHRSPQLQPPGMAGPPYSDPSHSHSPGLPSMDPQYLCGHQSLGPSYGSEYGGDSSSLYSESSYGQTPRRVLLDPETGKYFYIEVPVQPLRKMLFDPETGQYVEVLIPQQAMSHSGLYPPSAAPFSSLHNPSMYAPAPHYMPYAAPPPPAHPQAQPQPPRYPEASAATAMHPSGSGVSYRNPSSQGSKPEPPNHPTLDQSYLESMYYVPTGMNVSPNPTPPDYYHKHPPNLPPTGGKRS